MMRHLGMMLLILLAVGTTLRGQQNYLPRAEIQRRNGSATVTANDPRPLWEAISALRKEYGWVVDYEEPVWPSDHVRDISPARWHAAHPGRTGFLVPSGGAFQSSYREAPDMWSSASEELQALDKLVTDYNTSGNPGTFTVRAQTDGSYAVIGFDTPATGAGAPATTALLDTPISLDPAPRTADNTVLLILSALSAKSGTPVRLGYSPTNLLYQSTVDVGGSGVSARSLLIQLFQAMRVKMSWDLWYEPNLRSFILRIRPAVRAVPGMFGRKRMLPVSPTPTPSAGGP